MIAQTWNETQVLWQPDVHKKLAGLPAALEVMKGTIPNEPGRDVQIVPIRQLPDKIGLSFREGQARLLHDLASIELQAMELALRTLFEFPDIPREFCQQLAQVCVDEGRHLKLCLEGLESLGLPWGSYPTHLGLWQCVSAEDSLLDRILIVHRYLEGSGLDASHTLLNRLSGVSAPEVRKAVQVIATDEMGHVDFGSRWYREICRREKIEAADDFQPRLNKLSHRIPRRLEKINVTLRTQAGFSPAEISSLQLLRQGFLAVSN